MSFAALKEKFQVSENPNRFRHLSHMYSISEGWENDDRPTGRVYINPAYPGVEFFSATTMISKVAEFRGDDKWLIEWRKRVGEEEAKRISEEATTRGNHMHQNLQDYVENKVVTNNHMSGYRLFEKVRPYCDERITAVIASEGAFCSELLKVAGRIDLVAVLYGDKTLEDPQAIIDSGVEAIVDFKSSRRIKKSQDILDYYIQTTLYSMMFHETTGVRLEMGEIWMGCDNSGSPVAIDFDVMFGHYREMVIDMLDEYWQAHGGDFDAKKAKDFFL